MSLSVFPIFFFLLPYWLPNLRGLINKSQFVVHAGKEEIDQLDKIFQIMGTPTPETWPGVEKLPM